RRSRSLDDAGDDHLVRVVLGPVLLPGREGAYELQLAGGSIAAIRPSRAGAGLLALPAFTDLHVHADRAFAGG
ncbi:MAG: hypothetical protein C4306_12180, partial [Thermoleophilia bacterium]